MSRVASMRLARQRRLKLAAQPLTEYDRGKVAGTLWAAANVLPSGDGAPFTTEYADSAYNMGVLHGIVQEIHRFADELAPCAGRPAKTRFLRHTTEPIAGIARAWVSRPWQTMTVDGIEFRWASLGKLPALVTVTNSSLGSLADFTSRQESLFARSLAQQLIEKQGS